MEVSMMSSSCCSQTKIGKFDSVLRELEFNLNKQILLSKKNSVCFGLMKRSRRSVAIQASPARAIHVEVSKSEKITGVKASILRSESEDVVNLFVGLPLDTISDCNELVHARAIGAGLRALKLLGVEGVEVPVWWGIVEKEAMGKYNWSGYIALAKMVQDAGLKLRVSLCFHASKKPAIPLPQWVSQIGDSQPDIFFSDRSGKRYKDCLSFAVDELPVLDGRSPLQVYQGFLESFKSSFSAFMGSTITDISIGLGPNGELRYPSDPPTRANLVPGAGEFQCFDRHMLNHLKQQAEAIGNHYWGLTGPHDAPTYNQLPNSNSFFKENGGSWRTPYGHFFLSWYSNQLISHGDRLLSLASATFSSSSITISGKIPLVHSWYNMQSHPSEMTAGFYNSNSRNGYDSVAEMFARNSCKMILPGMDLSDKHQPQGTLSSPELLLSQIKNACGKHGVQVSGENSSLGTPNGYDQIKKNLSTGNALVDSFTYQRMGAYFFSPENFPSFTEFVRSLNEPELHPDDMPTCEKVEASEAVNERQMQEA